MPNVRAWPTNAINLINVKSDELTNKKLFFFKFEKIELYNINNGERFETYVIKGERASGTICLNGPAARKVGRRYCYYYILRKHGIWSG